MRLDTIHEKLGLMRRLTIYLIQYIICMVKSFRRALVLGWDLSLLPNDLYPAFDDVAVALCASR